MENSKPVLLDDWITIPNIFDLPKIGAGHDGVVYRYGDMALKLLKYDLPTRKEKNLMTYTKALYFRDEIHPKRIINPQGLLSDEDGQYCGYSMPFIDDLSKKSNPNYRDPSSFRIEELYRAITDLEDDVMELNSKGIVMKDINRGGYMFDSSFMKICDMDKFSILARRVGLKDLNNQALNFIFAKFFLYELKMHNEFSQESLKVVTRWIKNLINDPYFIPEMKKELDKTSVGTIGEYLEEKKHLIL